MKSTDKAGVCSSPLHAAVYRRGQSCCTTLARHPCCLFNTIAVQSVACLSSQASCWQASAQCTSVARMPRGMLTPCQMVSAHVN